MKQPTPKQIRSAREKAGLTQTQAGELVHATRRTWQNWETDQSSSEHRPISLAAWELFLIKTDSS